MKNYRFLATATVMSSLLPQYACDGSLRCDHGTAGLSLSDETSLVISECSVEDTSASPELIVSVSNTDDGEVWENSYELMGSVEDGLYLDAEFVVHNPDIVVYDALRCPFRANVTFSLRLNDSECKAILDDELVPLTFQVDADSDDTQILELWRGWRVQLYWIGFQA